MTNYYNSLCCGKETVHKKSKFGSTGYSPGTTKKTSRGWLASMVLIMALFVGQLSFGQTTIIDPTTSGAFEGASFTADGWTVLNNATAGASWVQSTGATTGFTGSQCAYITADVTGVPPAHTYTNSASKVSALYRDVTVPAGETQISLSFKWIGVGESGYDRLQVWAVPTTYTPLNGTASMTTTGTAPTGRVQLGAGATGYQSSGSWTTANITVPAAYAGTTFRLVFQWRNDASGGSNPPIAVDNVSLVSSCTGVATAAATVITTTSATLNAASFTGATGYNFRYRVVGAPSWTNAPGNPYASPSAPLSGLTSATSYEYQAAATGPVCNTYSPSNGTFLTLCDPISTFPWNEGFETVTTGTTVVGAATNLPACWNSQSTKWSSALTGTYNTPNTGTKYIRYAWSTTNAFIWTPGFQLTSGQSYDFSFYGQGDGNTGWNNDVYVSSTVTIDGTGANQLTPTYTAAGPGSTTMQTYVKTTRTFVPATSGVYYFAIRGNQASASPWYMAFDDFKVELTPACSAPSAVTSNTVTSTSANIAWSAPTAGSTPAAYNYEVRSSGAAGSGSTGLAASGTSATSPASVSGLMASTTYSIYVQSDCGGGSLSAWTSAVTFTTSCNSVSLPYTQDFESVTVPAIPVCTSIQTVTGNPWTTNSPNAYGFTSKALRYLYNSVSAANSWFYLPAMDLVGGTTYKLDYKYGAAGFAEQLKVSYGTAASAASMSTLIVDNGSFTTSPLNGTGTFTPATSGTYYIGFNAYSLADEFYLFVDDISVVEFTACSGAPAAAVASSSVSSVCDSVPYTLSVTGATVGSGISYQWESADDAAFTTGVTALGTSLTQAIASQTITKYYRFSTTCITGPDTTYSNVVTVTQNSPTQCYCTPVTTSGCTDGDVIARVVLNTLDNNSGTGCPSATLGYSDYTTNPALTTTLQAGSTYSCIVTAGQYSEWYGAWIDYNDDGVFDNATERIGYTTAAVLGSGVVGTLGSSAGFPITLSCNPPLGDHRLRVRAMYGLTAANVSTSMTPCGNNDYGEVEDYIITISAADPCPTPSLLTASTATTTSATLGWKQGCAESEWDVFVQTVGASVPTGSTIPTTTGITTTSAPGFGTYDVSGLTAGFAYEYYVRATCDSGAGLYSSWAGPFTFITVVPGCTVLSTPTNGTTGLALGSTVNFTWNAPSVSSTQSAATSYDLYLTLNGVNYLATSPTNIVGTAASIALSATVYGTYSMRIEPRNAAGVATGCSESTFSTISDPCLGVNPAGDTFATAIDLGAITTAGSSTVGNNLASNCYSDSYTTTSTPGNAAARPGRDVFYKFEITDLCNSVTIATCGADFDTYLNILNASGTRVAFNDDGCGTASTLTTSALTPGIYYAVVEGYAVTGEGSFTLAFTYTTTPATLYYVDADNDTYGDTNAVGVASCTPIVGSVTNNLDCLDTNAAVHPGAVEICNDGLDNNCDGTVDEGCPPFTTKLSSVSCDTTLPFIFGGIYAEIKSGTEGYRFEFTNMSTMAVQTVDRNVQYVTLRDLSSYSYGTVYSVRVSLKRNGVWLNVYGDACTVTTPGLVSSTLGSASIVSPTCGSTVPFTSGIYTTPLTGVTGYRFRVTRTGDAPVVIDRPTQFIRLNMLTNYVYNSEYTVEVAIKTTGSYGAYGPACVFNSENTTILASNCGSIVPASGTVYASQWYNSGTQYDFEVTNLIDSSVQVISRTVKYFPVSLITGYASTVPYSVKVAVTSTGVQSAYGDSCIINPAAPADRIVNTLTSDKSKGYPNPFTNQFTLDVASTSDANISVMVYDMIGKLLERVELSSSDSKSIELGSNYPAGMYNVIVTQGERVESVRMIKN